MEIEIRISVDVDYKLDGIGYYQGPLIQVLTFTDEQDLQKCSYCALLNVPKVLNENGRCPHCIDR